MNDVEFTPPNDETELIDHEAEEESKLTLSLPTITNTLPKSYSEAYLMGVSEAFSQFQNLSLRYQKETQNEMKDLGRGINNLNKVVKELHPQYIAQFEEITQHYSNELFKVTNLVHQKLETVATKELKHSITLSLEDAHRRAAMIPVKVDKSVWLTIIGLSLLIGSAVGAGVAFLFGHVFV